MSKTDRQMDKSADIITMNIIADQDFVVYSLLAVVPIVCGDLVLVLVCDVVLI